MSSAAARDLELEYALAPKDPSQEPPPAAETLSGTEIATPPLKSRRQSASSDSTEEGLVQRIAFLLIALTLLAGFWALARQFRVAAHGGGDQNAYLVGGRHLAERFSTALWPEESGQFVGPMWVSGKGGRYVPKYPPGYPLLVAFVWKAAHLTGHGATAANWVYEVNPALMTLALLGVFLLARCVAGSAAGLVAVVVAAASPVTFSLANNPNSHAASLCFGVWAMYLLLRWWKAGGIGRAVIAGLLLGLAATVRYAEAMLVLPLVLIVLFNLRRSDRSWGHKIVLLAGWALPILIVLAFNYAKIGRWTGYDASGESQPGEGFKWEYFRQNWAMMLRQLNGVALIGFLPIGVLGLLVLPAMNWRVAAVLWAWLLPGVLLYTSYYWAPVDHGTVHYLRFFLGVFPPIAVGVGWLVARVAPVGGAGESTAEAASPRPVVWHVGTILFVLGVGTYNLWNALPLLEVDYRRTAAVAQAADKLIHEAKVPPGSIVSGPEEFLNHLQLVTDYRLYAADKAPAGGFIIEPGSRKIAPGRREVLRWTEDREPRGGGGGGWWRRAESDPVPPANWRLVEVTPARGGVN